MALNNNDHVFGQMIYPYLNFLSSSNIFPTHDVHVYLLEIFPIDAPR